MHRFLEAYHRGALTDLDALFENRPEPKELTSDDFIVLKQPIVRKRLAAVGIHLDDEQERAITHPARRLLISARAGSGKTHTLCARAVLAIQDENLDPNQALILAFNKGAAREAKDRVRNMGGLLGYDNARTFHSLAYQLVKPKRTLLFDAGGHPSEREQTLFVQRMMSRILNPAFKEQMVEFFRKELEQVEQIGRDLSPEDYQTFRRALEHVTLKGERVKSNGEKFIADFLFEHDVVYRYERVWEWKTDCLDGGPYRPDFSLLANGKDYILEHWALDPDDRGARLPEDWAISTFEYRLQVFAKREFWRSKGVVLLETHAGMMRNGREEFERQLKRTLEGAGIPCRTLPKVEIVRRVFENDFAISHMADLFAQFIRRGKKRGWSADEVERRIKAAPDQEPRAKLFHELALRGYREYQDMLVEQQTMDFDDLLMQATDELKARGASASIHLGQSRMISIGDLRWILLDEFQDFSELYFRMLAAILEVNHKIRVVAVGDDWQAINGYAGAELRFFGQYAQYIPGAQSVECTTNYRSDTLIVEAGNRLMYGRGQPAKANRSASGTVEVRYVSDMWVEFRQGENFAERRKADAVFLPARGDGKSSSAVALWQAQVLKTCAEIIREAPNRKVILLARTSRAYGLDLVELRTRLIRALSSLLEIGSKQLEDRILAMTAHKSKGQEAHTVIILDATQRQFPKNHPDNLLFGFFGVTPGAVLDEERRLFYVAMTRAEQRLFVLTDRGEESPYLEVITRKSRIDIPTQHGSRERRPLGKLGGQLQEKIGALAVAAAETPAIGTARIGSG